MNEKTPPRGKVAVLVPNHCNPDYRVIKHAYMLKTLGYDVRIFRRGDSGTGKLEDISGVTFASENFYSPKLLFKFCVLLLKRWFARKSPASASTTSLQDLPPPPPASADLATKRKYNHDCIEKLTL